VAGPFPYVSPEQFMKDRAEFARKGIARGRALVAVAFDEGVVFVGENPSRVLYKTSEIYDRIGFAAVGKYNEFESLRVAGIRLADVKGYQYGREDVTAKSLANAYSQSLGSIFTEGQKPFEVELLVAQIGTGPGHPLELYHILYDGSIVDEHSFVAIGGEADSLLEHLRLGWSEGMSLAGVVGLAMSSLSTVVERDVPAGDLEVSGLRHDGHRRRFFRLDEAAITELLG